MSSGVLHIQALTRVNPTVYDSVAALCDDPATTVVVFSGSDKVSRSFTAVAYSSMAMVDLPVSCAGALPSYFLGSLC